MDVLIFLGHPFDMRYQFRCNVYLWGNDGGVESYKICCFMH